MSWSKTASIAPNNEKKVRIKTKFGEMNLTDLETESVGRAVSAARNALPKAIAVLSWPTTATRPALNAIMAKYFLIPASGATTTDINTIISKLELVMNGICTKLNVKVAPDPDAYGYVRSKYGALQLVRGAFSSRQTIGTRGGERVARGDIHLDQDVLNDDDMAEITFIHEATHKYASTADHDKRGYLEADDSGFQAPGLTKAEALNNADSYAYFCYHAARI